MPNPQIFRQYDIRGIVGRDLDPEVAFLLGRAFGTVVRRRRSADRPRVVVGRDNRLSSEMLAEAFREGATATGAAVLDVGLVPTPVLYFAGEYLEADGAAQITGSHNPPEYNGFKLSIDGRSLHGDAIQQIRSLIESDDFEAGVGSVENHPMLSTYVDFLCRRFAIDRPVRVVMDCGNGTGSVVAPDLIRAISPAVDLIPLYCESDGTFPNHHPDPVVDQNLADLRRTVRDVGAEVGIAFDGDADRIGVIDEKGNIIRGDTLLLIFALDLLERRGPGQKIVFDVKCSQALTDVLTREGGVPIMSATGHSLIKERMKAENALLAGELSGHICFAEDYFGFDDALFAACLLLSILSRSSTSLSERVAEFPEYASTPELRYPAPEERKFAIVREAVSDFAREYQVIDVDGARVVFPEGWGLVRASNTEPALVGRYEATSSESLDRIRSVMESWLSRHGIEVG